MMHRLLKAQTRQPATVQLGPGRTPVMAALAQQKSRELLPRPAQRVHRIQTGTHQIAHRLVPGIWNPDSGHSPARCSRARLAASRRSVLTRSPARLGISDGATTMQPCPLADNWRWMP